MGKGYITITLNAPRGLGYQFQVKLLFFGSRRLFNVPVLESSTVKYSQTLHRLALAVSILTVFYPAAS